MKKFTLSATEENGMVTCYCDNNGFSGPEIIGILEMKKYDTAEQLQHPELFKRYAVDSDGVRKEIVKEGESVMCCDCKHCEVVNSGRVYAKCTLTGLKFAPFGLDTREHSCNKCERKKK